MRAVAGALFVLVLLPVGLSSQEGAETRRDPVLERLVMEARTAPPEFAADILLRVAASGRIDRARTRELIEDAYLLAYTAVAPYRRVAYGVPPDTRQGAQGIASDTPLTRVSLQVRAVQQLAPLAPERSRELFEWIDLDLVPATCTSPLVPAVDEYYTALAALARTTFGSTPEGRADALRFLTLYLFRAHLPTEMPAVARALRRFRPSADEALYLESTFRWILETSLRDPRGFSTVSLDLVGRLMELEDADRELGLPNWTVARMLRDYLVTQFKGPRCSDSTSDGPAADAYNGALRLRDILPETIAPIAQAETRPSGMLGIVQLDRYWQRPDARRLYEIALRLRGTGRNPLPERLRREEAWMTQAEHLIADLEQWIGLREPERRDYLYQKAVVYTILLDLIPRTPLRVRAIRSFVEFLRREDRDRESRPLWFAFVNRTIELSHGEDRRDVLEAMEQSNHYVLALYARLERVLTPGRRSN
jgi:hypothetical protein